MASPQAPRKVHRRNEEGVEVLPLDFDQDTESHQADPYWKRDHEMEMVLNEQIRPFDYVKVLPQKIRPTETQEQVRFESHSDERVDSYAEQMRQGAIFPAGTVEQDFHRVDLHHRLLAAERAGRPYVVVIRIKQELPPKVRAYIAACRNSRHGEPLTLNERMIWAVHDMNTTGETQEQAAKRWGVPVTSLRRARQKVEMVTRAKDLDVTDALALIGKTAQNVIAAADLHDEPFKEAVRLVAARGFNSDKTKTLIQKIEGASSDEKALEVIKECEKETALPSARRAKAIITDKERYDRFMKAAVEFEAVTNDQQIMDSLTKIPQGDERFDAVQAVMAGIEVGWDALLEHFGVEEADDTAA